MGSFRANQNLFPLKSESIMPYAFLWNPLCQQCRIICLVTDLIQGTTHWIKLNPVNYFVSFVPVHVNLPAILLADAAAFAGILLLLLIPTLFISRVDPAETVKTE